MYKSGVEQFAWPSDVRKDAGEEGAEEMRIFIADDSVIVRERLTELLLELPEVEIVGEAGTAGDATLAIRELKPDVVILDIQMPGGSGIDVLRTIRQEHLASRVIMLTNNSYERYREMCLGAGADFFFDKSTEFEKVITVCRELSGN
ncbi:MAG TPA: response regulator transcription factor [Blastocatellia bacterium]|nr:response regulator transcription factor [Blastocatellia bacterium]